MAWQANTWAAEVPMRSNATSGRIAPALTTAVRQREMRLASQAADQSSFMLRVAGNGSHGQGGGWARWFCASPSERRYAPF